MAFLHAFSLTCAGNASSISYLVNISCAVFYSQSWAKQYFNTYTQSCPLIPLSASSLGNNRSAFEDCNRAIVMNPKHLKALVKGWQQRSVCIFGVVEGPMSVLGESDDLFPCMVIIGFLWLCYVLLKYVGQLPLCVLACLSECPTLSQTQNDATTFSLSFSLPSSKTSKTRKR